MGWNSFTFCGNHIGSMLCAFFTPHNEPKMYDDINGNHLRSDDGGICLVTPSAITGNVIGDGETILPAGSMRFFGWCVFSFVIGSAYSSSSCEDEPGGGTEKSSSEDNNDGAGGDAS